MKYLKLLLILTIALVIASPALPALAIADPDTPPSINGVYVYENLLEDGDLGVLVEYYLDYAVPPTETAAEAYMAIFIDSDGTTQLKSVAPYVFQNDGYDGGIIWIYFTATEVTTHGITSVDEALYSVWLCGNPTLAWAGDPPKTIGTIDYWQPVGTNTTVLFGQRVLYFADKFELAWTLTLLETTPLGDRLAALGESYFTNVIQSLRLIAPNIFTSGTLEPIREDIDYTTLFGAIIEDGTGTLPVSPLTLVEGANVVTINAAGTFTLDLERGTEGTAVSGTVDVTGSPATLVYGLNTITVPAAPAPPGTITVTVDLVNTQTVVTDTVIGTGFDLTDVATAFGMSAMMFSGLVWLIISIIICAGVYGVDSKSGTAYGSGKLVLLVFDICIIGGAVLGMIPVLAIILLSIGFGAITGYTLFYKGANV